MLDISFDTLLKTNTETGETTLKSVKPGKARKVMRDSLKLGDPGRLDKLPDEVTPEFLDVYRDGLDRYLHAYVANNTMTLTEAARYKEYIFDTVFGNTQHLGLFQFIRAKAASVYPNEKEMVTAAENFLMRGWHILHDAGRWWVVNDSFDKLLDVTGSSDISEKSTGMVFTPDTAHLFLADDVASKVSALAKKAGFDADVLAGIGQLDLLLAETDNREFAGYLMNYNAMRVLLRKTGKYSLLRGTTTFNSLYEDGYRLGNQIFYPALSRVILEKGSDTILLTPVSDELDDNHTVNKTLLAKVASDVRRTLYSKRVFAQELHEVEEFGYSVALMSEFWETDATRDSVTDIYGMLRRLDSGRASGSVSASYYDALRSSLSEILIGEVLLLGNDRFTLSSFGLDSVGGKFFIYATENVFSDSAPTKPAVVEELQGGNESFFTRCLHSGFSRAFVEKNLGKLLEYASDSFKKAALSAVVNTKDYHLELDGVTEFIETAKTKIRGAE